jgi:hypothetical protein
MLYVWCFMKGVARANIMNILGQRSIVLQTICTWQNKICSSERNQILRIVLRVDVVVRPTCSKLIPFSSATL